MHSKSYKDHTPFIGKRVVIVGVGNSGAFYAPPPWAAGAVGRRLGRVPGVASAIRDVSRLRRRRSRSRTLLSRCKCAPLDALRWRRRRRCAAARSRRAALFESRTRARAVATGTWVLPRVGFFGAPLDHQVTWLCDATTTCWRWWRVGVLTHIMLTVLMRAGKFPHVCVRATHHKAGLCVAARACAVCSAH